jgi:PAS domain S-box-containing protein
MLGYTVDEMVGMHLFDIMDGEGRTIAEANLERRRHAINEHHDFKFTRRDGSSLWAILSTSPLLDDQGSYVGALALVTDVTERRKTEARLRELASLRERT